MSYADLYRKRLKVLGETTRKRNEERQKRQFDLWFANTLDKWDCVIDGVPTQAVFQDHSQSNNKDLSDDKYLIVPNDVTVDVGSYVMWQDEEWLVFTEEHKTIPSHQQLKIKQVNRRLKWLTDTKNKTICNNGRGWGAYIQNQTLYTLGVSFSGEHIPLANAKMSVFTKDTPETRNVQVGTRMFIAGQVYKVEFADYVSRVGLINWLLDEDTKNPEVDNVELEVADYWTSGEHHNDEQKDTPSDTPSVPVEPPKEEKVWNIEGTTKARLGHSYTYSVKDSNGNDVEASEWIVGDIETLPFYVGSKDTHSITITVKDDFRYVGQMATIAAKVDGVIKNIAIKIIKKFG